jgi:type I restriction enzyme S subunit
MSQNTTSGFREDELPEGWALTLLDYLGKWSTGGTPSRKNGGYFGGPIPWVKSGDLTDGLVTKTDETLSQEGISSSAAKLLPAGTLSIALYGATIGKLGVLDMDAATNQACANCVVDERVARTWFLFYFLLQQRKQLIEAGQGGAQPNLTNQIIRNWQVAIPPLHEQQRIVAKVEALLAHVTATRQQLAKVPAILKRFRQSVLAAACSGRLTADWREKNASGGGTTRFAPVDSESGELPSTWSRETLEKLCDPGRPISYGVLKPGEYVQGGIPLLRIVDIVNGTATLDNVHRISRQLSDQYRRTTLLGNEIVVSLVGTIGRIGYVPQALKGGNLHRNLGLVAPGNSVFSRYLYHSLSCPEVQSQIESVTSGANQPLFNLADLRQLTVPLPPLAEQQEIVRRVEALFRLADAIEKRVAAATARVEKLTQAILAKAFRGELVQTEAELARAEDRDYEPASVLLERIRKERAQAAQRQTGNGSRRPRRLGS